MAIWSRSRRLTTTMLPDARQLQRLVTLVVAEIKGVRHGLWRRIKRAHVVRDTPLAIGLAAKPPPGATRSPGSSGRCREGGRSSPRVRGPRLRHPRAQLPLFSWHRPQRHVRRRDSATPKNEPHESCSRDYEEEQHERGLYSARTAATGAPHTCRRADHHNTDQ
jgi:hypothetical protein